MPHEDADRSFSLQGHPGPVQILCVVIKFNLHLLRHNKEITGTAASKDILTLFIHVQYTTVLVSSFSSS